jgi:hypothetical protein
VLGLEPVAYRKLGIHALKKKLIKLVDYASSLRVALMEVS